jgi:hypothetical protein
MSASHTPAKQEVAAESGRQAQAEESGTGLQLSISNIRLKRRFDAGIDLEQAPLDLFETALANGDLTVARDALLAYRQDTQIPSANGADRILDSPAEHSTVHLSSASETVDTQSTLPDSAIPTARSQGGRLEKLILDIETEVRAEYESNWRKSVDALTELEQALQQKATDTNALEQRVAELEDAVALQRENHTTQVEQLTSEYEQQLSSLQSRNQQLLSEYDRRIDELTVSRESTLDELETAWNAIAEEKQRFRNEVKTQQQRCDQQIIQDQKVFSQRCREEETALENRRQELETEVMKQNAQLDLDREQLKSSQTKHDQEHTSRLQRLAHEREMFDSECAIWQSRGAVERTEMASFRETQEQELGSIRAEISREQAEWDATREQKTTNLNEELDTHQKAVGDARLELRDLADQTENEKQDQSKQLEAFERDFQQRADQQRVELQQELLSRRSAWREEEERERARLRAEKDSLSTAVEQLQMLLARRKAQHNAELGEMRADCERANQEWSVAERTRLEQELASARQAIVDSSSLFDEKCGEWKRKRAAEAALLQTERERIQSESEVVNERESALEAERARLTDQIAQLKSDGEQQQAEDAAAKAAIEKERADSERVLHEERQTHFEELQARQAEIQRRQSIVDEKIRQHENGWAERQRQIEHDFESRRQLHQRDLEQQSADWKRVEKQKRVELENEERAIRQQRAELDGERARHQTEIEEANRKLVNDRHLLQDGLTQMDAQLKWVATHLDSQDIIPFQPRKAETDDEDDLNLSAADTLPLAVPSMSESSEPDCDAENYADDESIDQGWVETIQEANEPNIARPKHRIPAGGETEWAGVVESAYSRSTNQAQDLDAANTNDAENDVELMKDLIEAETQEDPAMESSEPAPSDCEIEEDGEIEATAGQGTDKIHRLDGQQSASNREQEADDSQPAECDAARRKALKDYRVKLLDLQTQLGELDGVAEQNSIDE